MLLLSCPRCCCCGRPPPHSHIYCPARTISSPPSNTTAEPPQPTKRKLYPGLTGRNTSRFSVRPLSETPPPPPPSFPSLPHPPSQHPTNQPPPPPTSRHTSFVLRAHSHSLYSSTRENQRENKTKKEKKKNSHHSSLKIQSNGHGERRLFPRPSPAPPVGIREGTSG